MFVGTYLVLLISIPAGKMPPVSLLPQKRVYRGYTYHLCTHRTI